MKKHVRVAVVGAGIYGINHITAYMSNKQAVIVAVCDKSKKIRKKMEEEFGLKTYSELNELLANEEVDVCSIATPDAYHLEPALIAIEHGLDIFVEKPLATKSEDAIRIIEAAKAKGVRVALDYHKRWDPAAINVKQQLHLSSSGKIIRGYMSMDDIIDVPTKWFNWSNHSSPVHFLGTHCYDQIRWYTGSEVTKVFAVGSHRLLKSKGIDTYDSVQAILFMDDGSHWVVENSWVLPNGFPKNNGGRTEILCDHAYYRLDSQNRGVEMFNEFKTRTPNSYFIVDHDGVPTGFGIQPMHDFITCIIENKPFVADARDGLAAELIAEAVHKSLDTGEVIEVEQ